ncbi:MAG: carbamate kinase [Clostridia bacterium]|nr:carbamate kinase [Clostridia bacterium]
MKTIVIALGGNAILQPGQKGAIQEQLLNVDQTAVQIAELSSRGHRVVVTHGNGPQVGAILIQNAAGSGQVPAMPLDVCGAESQGQIGYMLQQCLGRRLAERGIRKSVVTIVTQMVVSANDPAFGSPSKPVGPFYTAEHARRRMDETDEAWIDDAGRGWRRVVPSPDPVRMVERDAILSLVQSGAVVIANGGGGIPVCERDGHYEGVEAVIDKDLGGERLAHDVRADVFLILTDVAKVALNYKTANQIDLDVITMEELARYQQEGHFQAGSMGPKMEACRRFVGQGGEFAVIASLATAVDAIEGRAGTRIVR